MQFGSRHYLSTLYLPIIVACSAVPPKPKFGAVGQSSNTVPAATDAESVSTEDNILGQTDSTPAARTDTSAIISETPVPAPSYLFREALSNVSNEFRCKAVGALNIVGGTQATDADLVTASTVRIVFNRKHYCSGTLVGKNQIVTAAHCFDDVDDDASIEIGFGINSLPTNFKVKDWRVHPRYDGLDSIVNNTPKQSLADVAIITFEGELTTAMIPVPIADPDLIYTGMPVVVAGFGATYTQDNKRRPLSWIISEISSQSRRFNEIQFSSKSGKGACFGDSGGPTFVVGADAQCLHLLGSITGPNRGSSKCDNGGGLIMDLSRYRTWIGCTFKDLGSPLPNIDLSGQKCS